jgi:hypothetical protein
MKPSRSNPRGRTIARPAPIAIACLPSPDELLASAFLGAKSGDDRKALGRAIILQEARRRDCQFVKVTTEGEVFFHGHSGARSGRRFYLAGNTLEDFATEISRQFKRRKPSSLTGDRVL